MVTKLKMFMLSFLLSYCTNKPQFFRQHIGSMDSASHTLLNTPLQYLPQNTTRNSENPHKKPK